MKKIFVLSVIVVFLFSSCGTLSLNSKPIYLVDSPKDVEVYKGNKQLEVKNITLGSFQSSSGAKTVWKYPGILTKLDKTNKFTIKAGDKTAEVTLKTKRRIGLLIIEGMFTFGVFTIVDLITGGDRIASPKYIDVPAVLTNQKSRSEKDLRKAAYDSYK